MHVRRPVLPVRAALFAIYLVLGCGLTGSTPVAARAGDDGPTQSVQAAATVFLPLVVSNRGTTPGPTASPPPTTPPPTTPPPTTAPPTVPPPTTPPPTTPPPTMPPPTMPPPTMPPPTATPGAVVSIPAGSFQMGCDASNSAESCKSDEQHLHIVGLDVFSIDRTEVTSARYVGCLAAGQAQPRDSGLL